MKNVVWADILENTNIASGKFCLRLGLPEGYPCSVPGQFVNIYLNNEARLLPRPISVFDRKDGEIELICMVNGGGTEELSRYEAGTQMRISTPLGNGFDIPAFRVDRDEYYNGIVLVGGGMGIAPLHYLARAIHEKYGETRHKPAVSAILGYSGSPFLNDRFEEYCQRTEVCSEKPPTGDVRLWRGNVMLPIREREYYLYHNFFGCGPDGMLRALTRSLYGRGVGDVQVSLEERMGCGFGACVGCSIEVKASVGDEHTVLRKKVCRDGPVFRGDEVVKYD